MHYRHHGGACGLGVWCLLPAAHLCSVVTATLEVTHSSGREVWRQKEACCHHGLPMPHAAATRTAAAIAPARPPHSRTHSTASTTIICTTALSVYSVSACSMLLWVEAVPCWHQQPAILPPGSVSLPLPPMGPQPLVWQWPPCNHQKHGKQQQQHTRQACRPHLWLLPHLTSSRGMGHDAGGRQAGRQKHITMIQFTYIL